MQILNPYKLGTHDLMAYKWRWAHAASDELEFFSCGLDMPLQQLALQWPEADRRNSGNHLPSLLAFKVILWLPDSAHRGPRSSLGLSAFSTRSMLSSTLAKAMLDCDETEHPFQDCRDSDHCL